MLSASLIHRRALRPKEVVFRCVHHNKAFKSAKIDQKKMINFAVEKGTHNLLTSLVCQRYAPTLRHVHSYGCLNAKIRNARQQDKNGTPPQGSARDTYMGVYALKARIVETLKGEHSEIKYAEIVPVVEAGEIAHANLSVYLQTPVDPESISEIKTFLCDRLWRNMEGPIQHTCPNQNSSLPPAISLSDAPGGNFIDHRSMMARARDWISFSTRLFTFHVLRMR